MSAVIQATCPGCKKTLRIPADWVHKAIRCKHCGLVITAKEPTADTPKATASLAPAKRKEGTASSKPTAPARATLPPPAPGQAQKLPASKPVAPALPPQAMVSTASFAPVATSVDSPFGNLEDDAPAPSGKKSQPPIRRGGGGGWWKGPVIAVAVLLLAGVSVAVGWRFVGDKLRPQTQVASPNDKDKPSPKDGNSPPPHENPDTGKKPEVKPEPVAKPNETAKPEKGPPEKGPPEKGPPDKKPNPPPAGTTFPRRALVVSVHDYLYANPVGAGMTMPGARNMNFFVTKLATGLRIPLSQIAHLSDEAGSDKSRAPNKQVIEETLQTFLNTSRDQDRVMVFLIGHGVEIEGEAYFVPIEGEFGEAATLISLKSVYEMMKDCKARQKILVLDVGRFSATRGIERPGSFPTADAQFGPMTAKFDEALKNPPSGIQVWTSCVGMQMSYETDTCPVGVFLDSLTGVLAKGLEGTIQHADDLFPLDKLNAAVTTAMKPELMKFKLTQTPRVSGTEIEGGAPYDPKSPPAKPPVLVASANNRANLKLIQSVLSEVSTPPVKGGGSDDATIKFEMLPPFTPAAMRNYSPDDESMLEAPINKARAMLWAISTSDPPESLKKEVEAIRAKSKVNLSFLKDGFRSPANETMFKNEIAKHERQIADMIDDLEMAYKKYTELEFDRTKEPKRWLANYDYVRARMEEQIAYLYEYQSMLGQMRKELPPLDKAQGNGWKLASTEALNGDSKGKKMAKSSAALLKKMAEEHKGTPWEVLAKREKLTSIGLEWKTAVVK